MVTEDKIAHRNKLNGVATTVGGVIVVAVGLISATLIGSVVIDIVIAGLTSFAGMP